MAIKPKAIEVERVSIVSTRQVEAGRAARARLAIRKESLSRLDVCSEIIASESSPKRR
jgi:hypothetical protein